jgi:outer membrane protein OmpA-like peptidoglycan-associated protein
MLKPISRSPRNLSLAAIFLAALTGCATTDEYGNPRPMGETAIGAGIGTLAGAAAGAAIGSRTADAGKGALIGAIGGALIGTAVGNYMEEQRRDFEKVLADEIAAGDIRVDRGDDHSLVVGMTSATTFDVDSSAIKPGFYSTLDKIAGVVNKYGKTQLVIAGYTDDTGAEDYNQALSERRADAVASYLRGGQVIPERLSAVGYGERMPVASNETETGRELNRRVEISIIPVTMG